ncbi:MAG: 3-phosphoshikimate 1-carboxyvinyltransferase, partial [Oscillospiraceae bacterium]|nr:3-phosphoshikimate 1-carboxyvinyltransferase [Oscillospiraceae bacterium]
MNITITPTPLRGTLQVPPSKSQAHRLLIGAALASGTSSIAGIARSQDILATARCMRALGAEISERCETVTGTRGAEKPLPLLDCGESGSTLRFLIPVALAISGGGRFCGQGRLLQRPQTPYAALFAEKGIKFVQTAEEIRVEGRLTPGQYCLPGDVSSQFITGLLYALPLLPGDSELVLTTKLESEGYVDMTREALAAFGVHVSRTETGYRVPGGQRYRAAKVCVEGDYSQAAFFLAANGLGAAVTLRGLRAQSTQGDRVAVPLMQALGGAGEVTIDVSQCPDLVPALAARAALRDGQITHIVGAARLRIKESDRLQTVTAQLRGLGAQLTEQPDALTI